jgi:hypothetical protein
MTDKRMVKNFRVVVMIEHVKAPATFTAENVEKKTGEKERKMYLED